MPASLARLAGPLLGNQDAQRMARPRPHGLAAASWVLLAVLGASLTVGILLHASCMSGGYEQPHASLRMCASPVALSLLGEAPPEVPGTVTSGLNGFSLLTYWFTVAISSLGAAPAEGMAILLVLNTAAFSAMGVGMLVLAQRMGLTTTVAGWAAVGFLSPVIVFSMGQSLDPVGVAAAVWACVLLLGNRSTGTYLAAGALLALAVCAGPLGLVVLLGVLLGTSRDRGRMALVVAGSALVTGLILLLDGRFPARLSAWYADAIDRGSLASIALTRGWGDETALTTGLLVVWAFGLVALAALSFSRSMQPSPPEAGSREAASARSAGAESVDLAALRAMEIADESAHVRRTALTITAMLAFSVLVAPGSSTTLSLWLVPFAALLLPYLWAHAIWFFAELGFAIAVHLADVAAVDSSLGLSDTWMSIFTLLRFGALAILTACALDELLRRDR